MSTVIDSPADAAVASELRAHGADATGAPWVVVMCKFSDVPDEPQDATFFERLFTESGEGRGGMFDYWRDMSGGAITLTGSEVHGWFDLSVSLATARTWTWPSAREDLMRACIEAAEATVDFRPFFGIVAVINAPIDSGSAGRRNLPANGTSQTFGLVDLDPFAWFPTYAAHEMGHGFGLPHSFSVNGTVRAYGDGWDVMSAMTFGDRSPVYSAPLGTSGPGLCAAYRDLLGWLPSSEVLDLSSFGGGSTLTLSALEGGPPGTKLIRIFLGFSTQYYAVELRRTIGWDRGIGRSGVLVRRVDKGVSYLHPSSSGGYDMQAGDHFIDSGENLAIGVLGIDDTTGTALVHVGPPLGNAPLTTAALTPLANAAGWHNGDVTVTLSAASAPGGQVLDVASSASGANPLAPTTTPGRSVSFPVTREGRTTVVYAARDVSGASELPRRLEVRIDKTPPTTREDVSSPSPGAFDIALEATDQSSLSGFRSLQYEAVGANPIPATTTTQPRARLSITAAGPTTVFFWSTDNADNVEGPHTLDFRPVPVVTPRSLDLLAAPGSVSGPARLFLRNAGRTTLAVTDLVTTDSRFEVRPGSFLPCGPTLAPGATCTLDVVFAPLVAGVVTGSLFVSTNASATPIDVALTGTGAPSRLEFDVPTLLFPATPIRQTSAPLTVTVRNPGVVPLVITDVMAGDDYVVTGDTCGPFPRTLQPTQTCRVDVAFRPRGPGPRPGGLSVTSDAPGGPHLLRLEGDGIPVPELSADPATLLFRPQPLGTTGAPVRVTLTNTGTADVHISGTSLAGPAAGDFTVSGGSCLEAALVVLAPEQFCDIEVSFRPSAVGPRIGELMPASNVSGPPPSVPLVGEGIPTPAVVLDPTNVVFAAHPVGSTAPLRTVTLTNNGQTAVDIGAVEVTGTAAGDFAILSDTCSGAAVPAGGTCRVDVDFTPRDVGTRSGSLELTAATGTRYTSSLTGIGSGPLVSLDPAAIDFGALSVGGTERRDAIVRNTGNAPLTVTSLSTSGDFLHGQGCVFPVAPGSYCSVRLVFRPTGAGPRIGELVVTSDAPGSPHRLPLTGVGLVPAIGLSAAEIDFGPQPSGTTGPSRTLIVSSAGTAPLSVGDVALAGAHAAEFRVQDACGWRGHMPGATCAIEVAFAPTGAQGARTAELVIRDNAPGAPHVVPLTGTAT